MASQITTSVLKVAKHLQRCTCIQARPVITRSLATPAGATTVAENIRKKQEVFQIDEEKPVYIKGGSVDGILYRFTMGICVVSLLLIAKNFIQMALPKKK